MKGPHEMCFHNQTPRQQDVSAANEGMKRKVRSRQYYRLFEGATRQDLPLSDKIRLKN
ncbi:MAG: hypothetical protein K2I55_01735 [Phocaeicola sp.]|nr:hypothetical protein [Phocaeicola sp.]